MEFENRLLAQVMVDAEHLLLLRKAGQLGVQLTRRNQIVPERLLHHDALAARAVLLQQVGPMDILHRNPELARHGRQIEHQIFPERRLAK
jgi:hypothetical protein